MLKKELRAKYKELRKAITFEDIQEKSLAITNNVLELDIWDNTYFHLFLPIEEQKEVDTEFLLHVLQGKDKEIVISKSDFETREMTHFLLTDNTKIKKNEHNIPEPINGIQVPEIQIDVVFIPLLAFDRMGNRVGYGKGFYDLFLSKCKKDVIKIGFSFFEPEIKIDDVSENDIKLDFCITPEKVYVF